MAAKRPKKKRKHEIAEIFPKFRRDEKKMSQLNLAIKALFEGHQEMNLRVLQIKETDARSSKIFTRATCDTVPYHEGTVPTFTVGSVYSYGLHVLLQYIAGEKIRLPRKDTTIRTALQKLLEYLTADNAPTELTSAGKAELNEADFAVRLAEHLLSNLAVESNYTIENHYQHKSKTGRFPCKANEPLLGTFSDTSFGCPQAWHGSPDILINNVTVNVAVELSEDEEESCAGSKDPSDDTETGGESSVGVKSSDGFSEDYLSRMKAQTIVFSFLQKKQGGQLNNNLIPSVGISKSKVIVHFYDCVNDVLLSSTKLDLFVDLGNGVIKCNYPVILFLWLTLNYRLFCSGPTEEMKNFKSNFCEHVGQQYVEMYENQVTMPCKLYKKPEESGNWAKMWGKQGTIDSEIEYEDFTDEDT